MNSRLVHSRWLVNLNSKQEEHSAAHVGIQMLWFEGKLVTCDSSTLTICSPLDYSVCFLCGRLFGYVVKLLYSRQPGYLLARPCRMIRNTETCWVDHIDPIDYRQITWLFWCLLSYPCIFFCDHVSSAHGTVLADVILRVCPQTLFSNGTPFRTNEPTFCPHELWCWLPPPTALITSQLISAHWRSLVPYILDLNLVCVRASFVF